MGKYTLIDDETLDAIIEKDMNTIVDQFQNDFGENICSMVLIGGYGRGEGGVQIINDKNMPKNNYDILLVLNKAGLFSRKKIQKQLVSLKNKINQQQLLSNLLEVTFISKFQAKTVPSIMIYQDVYNSAKTIFGEKIQNILPLRVRDPLPYIEALTIIRNRSMLLLSVLLNKSQEGYDGNDGQQLKIWMAKVVIGFGDGILIIKNNYVTGYYDKMVEVSKLDFSDIFDDSEDYQIFKKLHKEASEYRLFGNSFNLPEDKTKILHILSMINLSIIKSIKHNQFNSWDNLNKVSFSYSQSLKTKIKNIISNFKEYGFGQNFLRSHYGPCDRLYVALPPLLYEDDVPYSSISRKVLSIDNKVDINGAREECNRLFMKYLY
ncbi:MAG: hypothetical protein HOJ35_08360 [Bdellovibrionales bacterium]|nr:hypothetical protein [Bdellovibrionales bacterium]